MSLRAAARVAAAVVGTLLFLAVLLWAVGRNPFETLSALFGGGFGTRLGLIEGTARMIPILLCALAASIPAKGGLFNIGGEGQLHCGALAGSAVALFSTSLPHPVRLPVIIGVAMVAGAMWALIPAILRVWVKVNEILVGLMLNYVAIFFVEYMVHGPWKDPSALGWPYTAFFPAWAVFPTLGRTNIHIGLLLGCFVAVITHFILKATTVGYSVRFIGANPRSARYGGIPVSAYLLALMAIGGAVAALAGIGEVSVIQGRLRPGISPGYGYTGFLVAWLANNEPLVILPAAFVVGCLYSGSDALQLSAALPSATIDIFMGVMFLAFLIADPLDRTAAPAKEKAE